MSRLTRRALLGLAGALAADLAPWPASAASRVPASASLRDHAAAAGMTFGSAITEDGLADPLVSALYTREVGIVTTDLELKFAWLRPDRETFSFGPADAVLSWADLRRIPVRGHTLIWNENNPTWLNRCSASEIERIFDEHIERVVSRYVGRIHTWDVVNEPFWPWHRAPGGYRMGPWFNALGPGYISRALRRVRAIDKTAKLCINEATLESDHEWGRSIRPLMAGLVGDLKLRGVPLDVIGLQSHLQPAWPHNYDRFAEYCTTLAAQGVDLHLTEFDVNDASFPDATDVRDRMVAEEAAAYLKPVLAVPAVKMLITWELADRLSFYWHGVHDVDPTVRRLPRPLPFDDRLQRKPMWTEVARAFDTRAGH